ncbi:PAAR domain-containing protein [Providencia stuartii]|nr:PAAR domain-containing protein [Providencia stuartii]MBQ0695271.1 PAAR domain-containing protein [Providencia stuartii]
MTMPSIIRLGDATSHGGKVISAQENFILKGRAAAVVGDQVSCPKCKGVYAIVEGSTAMKYKGKSLALEGMKTACGATLIASQSSITGK